MAMPHVEHKYILLVFAEKLQKRNGIIVFLEFV